MSRGVVVSPATSAQRPAACEALFAHLPGPDRTRRVAQALKLFAEGEYDPSGLLVAQSGGELAGAILVQFHAGRTAVAWPPGVPGGSAVVKEALARTAVAALQQAGVKQAQMLLPPPERDRAGALEQVGFRHVTQLAFLCRPLGPQDQRMFGPASGTVTFEPVTASPAFAAILMATYEGTLDCPELNGTRTAEEILEGYRSTADPLRAGDWVLVRQGGEPVGVVILTSGPRAGIRELSYLGLIPSARGRGLGQELLNYALSHAARADAEWLTLSVDVRNEPAQRLYRRCGFREYDRQDVYLWQPPG